MTPYVTGVVYKFVFDQEYRTHDGIYRLVKLMTYDEYLADGGNLMNDFFTPAGKTESNAEEHISAIRLGKMMKLINPDPMLPANAKYLPTAMLGETHDYNVNKYSKLGVVASIGIVSENETLDYVQDNLIEQFQSALGITIQPEFVSTGSVWLTDAEYNEEIAKRDHTMKKTINYFSEVGKLNEIISSKNTIIAEYEKIITSQNKTIEELKRLTPQP